MYTKFAAFGKRFHTLIVLHKRPSIALGAAVLLVPLLAIAASYGIVMKDKTYILNTFDRSAIVDKHVSVGIVLGAGITPDGKPYKELQARLDVAADALQHGEVQKLILSGDNRFSYYDEPTAMKNYLVTQRHINVAQLQPDYAGRTTYESCERAAKVFGLHQAIIFSANSHLPRAIYLCRHFGIESYGVASTAEANNATRREMLARVKAVLNVYVGGESSVLGAPIRIWQ